MWYSVFNLLYAAEYYSWAKNDKKVGSLSYKETEEGNLNFKLFHLSLAIDWVSLIKINSKLEYHFYLSGSWESMTFSFLDFFLFLSFSYSAFSPVLAAAKKERGTIPWCFSSYLSSSGNICTHSLAPGLHLQIRSSEVRHPLFLSFAYHVGTRRVCGFSQAEENPNSALP